MKVDDMFDILILVIWIVLGTTSIVWSLTTMKSTITSYETTDKVAVEVLDSNVPVDYNFTPAEIMLMTVVADANQPYPSNIKVNSNPTVYFDKNYFTDTTGSINSFWNDNMRAVADKTVKSFELVSDGAGGSVWKVTIN